MAAQSGAGFGTTDTQSKPKHAKSGKAAPSHPAPKSSQPPSMTIPVDALGFTTPGSLYLGMRRSFASLDFLDENRLLFTFRVPGLMRREGTERDETERQIRAVVLTLPSGVVQAEALWTVHDRARYLWMLKNGHFLLRDRDLVEEGDATLELKPQLRFPGPLIWLELDPSQKYLVTNSLEPAAASGQPADNALSPRTAAANMLVDGQKSEGLEDMVVRILRRSDGQVMLVSRTRSAVHLPIDTEGYVEDLRGTGGQWLVNLNYFNGGARILGHVESSCSPALDFVAERQLVATACDRAGASKLVALTSDGGKMWEHPSTPTEVWPILVRSPDGSRLARESLAVNHPVNAFSPLSSEDIRGQIVEVLDAATGQVALTATASPVLDGGGNVAISPSGQRVAVVADGAIEVFELPPAPPLP